MIRIFFFVIFLSSLSVSASHLPDNHEREEVYSPVQTIEDEAALEELFAGLGEGGRGEAVQPQIEELVDRWRAYKTSLGPERENETDDTGEVNLRARLNNLLRNEDNKVLPIVTQLETGELVLCLEITEESTGKIYRFENPF